MDATPQPDSKPGKIRTWWHPLLANFLRWQLGSHYQLEEEVPVGQKPLQIDVLLVRKEEGNLPVHAQQILAGLAEYFNDITLLEFKSPSDALRAGDLQTFLAYALLYRAQNEPLLAPDKLHLLMLARVDAGSPYPLGGQRSDRRGCGATRHHILSGHGSRLV